MAFQPLLKRIHFMMTKFVRLNLIVVDPNASDSIGPDFPLRSKFYTTFSNGFLLDSVSFLFLGILFHGPDLFDLDAC